MKRDVVSKSTVASFVGIHENLDEHNNSFVDQDFINSGLSKERYLLEKEFYKTYNPEVGFNTALVLGIMLVTLLLYVIYRTKIRKPLIAFFKRKVKGFKHRSMPQDTALFPDIEEHENYEIDNDAADTAECTDDVFYDEIEKTSDDKTYHLLPTFSFTDDEKQLPVVVMDMKSATADWVQRQHNFLEPGALILKVKSDTICPQGKEINPSKTQPSSNIYGAISQHCLSQVPSQSQYRKYPQKLNQSLPSLKTQDSVRSADSDGKSSRKVRLKGTKRQSISSEPKSPLPHPHLKQPIHLTPIIKIQNYDKSQRTTNDAHSGRRDSISSSSSDDPQILRITAENWNKERNIRKSDSDQEAIDKTGTLRHGLDDICSYCESLTKSQALKQYSVDIPTNDQTLHVPGIEYTTRSCQNITQMETTL